MEQPSGGLSLFCGTFYTIMAYDRKQLSQPDPEFVALFAKAPLPPPPGRDIQAYRKSFNEHMAIRTREIYGARLPAESEYRVEDHRVPVEGAEMPVRCLIPKGASKGKSFPMLYWIHGGGGRLGTIHDDDLFLRTLCVEFQICIVNIEYRLAPEYKFPVMVDDAYIGLKWAVENAPLLSASLTKGFIVGGVSAGAYLVAVITHRARDDLFFTSRPITGQILGIPPVVHPDAYPEKYKSKLLSVEEMKNSPILGKEEIYRCYNDMGSDPLNPECSPLLYPSHAGLPPAYFQVCGLDPLRDDGLLYEELLREAGVPTKLDVYPGVPHGFHLFFPIAQATKYDGDIRKGLAWLLLGIKGDQADA
ncbi:hypothetical protein CERSUDRAFT_96334 [Gelatoporia subvermispora B]|uniref:Alpha/beta hydrolase fold-3 domain-containing protein n=1 Tax=Ceriporiopsis subvermispora (strain B) TaxID=914234 RepID=M2PIV7_CERS8|nr:hypothetical protein CERSUDRAFT_96334 [Gelatoporia subvermispora B]